jgi:uncharacterized membrane protein YcaP (DUF421 family)
LADEQLAIARDGLSCLVLGSVEGSLMATDTIHFTMAITFFALWAVIGHIAVVRRRS